MPRKKYFKEFTNNHKKPMMSQQGKDFLQNFKSISKQDNFEIDDLIIYIYNINNFEELNYIQHRLTDYKPTFKGKDELINYVIAKKQYITSKEFIETINDKYFDWR